MEETSRGGRVIVGLSVCARRAVHVRASMWQISPRRSNVGGVERRFGLSPLFTKGSTCHRKYTGNR